MSKKKNTAIEAEEKKQAVPEEEIPAEEQAEAQRADKGRQQLNDRVQHGVPLLKTPHR